MSIASTSPMPARRAAFKRYLTIGLILVALLAFAALSGPRLLFGPQVAVATIEQRDFVQSVVASGRVETPHRVDIGVQITDHVRRVPVTEGQTVAAGDTLIELAATENSANLRQAQSAVQQAQARLRQLREVQLPVAEHALQQAQANHAAARSALQRSRDLLAKGFISQAALDEAVRAEQVAAAQVEVARRQQAGLQPDGSDTALAVTALAQAQAGFEAAQARLQYASVLAPVAGTLIARNVEPGDVVQAGKVLMVLSPAGEVQLVVQIDEKNLRLLQLGQPALASADAYPQQRFAAQVVYINPSVDPQRGTVEVKLRVPQPPAYLRQDMTVSVDIEVARRNKAIMLPLDTLHEADGQAPWVLKVEAGHAQRQPVTLGLRSAGYGEVLSGLKSGDRVLPLIASNIAEGDALRPISSKAVRR